MTWSIVAREPDGRFGLAIASRFFAVGALCIHAKAGVGALATQALMNPLYGPRGLALLQAGHGAAEVVALMAAHAARAETEREYCERQEGPARVACLRSLGAEAAPADLPPFSVPPVWNISAGLMNFTLGSVWAGLRRQLAVDAGMRSAPAGCGRSLGAA